MTVSFAPFGTYANVTGVVNTTAAAEIVALIAELKTLVADEAGGTNNAPFPHPDFDQMPPALGSKIVAEIDALAAAIAAAPTS